MNNFRHFDFNAAFQLLTDNSPFPWQEDLYARFVAGNPPAACDIPTSLGKTAVVAIWLIALAAEKDRLPRRLVYVVSRRTVVDQISAEVERIRANLLKKTELSELKDILGSFTFSTLRGQLADNRKWSTDPSLPAVIVGTVDIIGGALLFNGCRAGSWQLARNAGLIGHDAMLVHDEAHLEPSFQKLMEWIDQRQKRDGSPRPLKIMAMSAFSSFGDGQNVLTITNKDRQHPVVRQRFSDVHKELLISEHDPKSKKLSDQLIELAWRHAYAKVRVIVYVRRSKVAREVRDGLIVRLSNNAKAGDRVALLTDTIRGYECRRLLTHPAVHGLIGSYDDNGLRIPPPHTTWLVATSAGEVGADFDADHLVCDLSPMDSMIQRFGRVNRRGGEARIAQIAVMVDRPRAKKGGNGEEIELNKFDQARLATAALLEKLPLIEQEAEYGERNPALRNASPAALRDLVKSHFEDYASASSPVPPYVPPQDVVLDAWALTSIQDDWSLCHEVHPYLHGLDEQTPHTVVAWRVELDQLSLDEDTAPSDVRAVVRTFLRYYPLRRLELLSEKPSRVADVLETLRQRQPNAWVVLLRQRSLEVIRLADVSKDPKHLESQLRYQTVLLPSSLGGLTDAGMLERTKNEKFTPVCDVADLSPSVIGNQRAAIRRRILLTRNEEGMWKARILAADITSQDLSDSQPAEMYSKWTVARDSVAKALSMKYVARAITATDDDGPSRMLLFFRVRENSPGSSDGQRVTISDHNMAALQATDRMVRSLNLESSLQASFHLAAEGHDLGKSDARWQRAIRNDSLINSFAMSIGKGFNWSSLDGYRHEFGSLREVVGRLSEAPDDEVRDLALHLIAAHHGRGRPHFDRRAMAVPPDLPDDLPELLQPDQIGRRFARLQRRFGHWGLAWLESILMAADAGDSTLSSEVSPDEVEEDEK